MARQNIDEEWKTDPRRTALAKKLGSTRLADGMRVEINWMVLDHRGKPVPLNKFQFVDDFQAWIDCGLAKIEGDFVRIAGADRYTEFFEKQSSNGKKGGRPRKPKKTQKNPNENMETQKKPEKPSFSSSFSSSSSSSFSSSFSGSSSNSEKAVSSKLTKAGAFIVGYKSRFSSRWGASVNVEGKDAGVAKRVAERLSYEDIELYLDAFFQMPDAELIKKKHPVFLFEIKLNEISVFAQTSEFTTWRSARDSDSAVTSITQLQRIRDGKL